MVVYIIVCLQKKEIFVLFFCNITAADTT